jgi:glucose-6-phosphate isomerase
LIASVANKRDQLMASWQTMSVNLNGHQSTVDTALAEIRDNQIVKRIWQHDHTVWRSDPTEITNRLGWLHSPENMPENVDRIMGMVEAVRNDGYTHVLLLGMGGSSLAPEMFAKVFGESADGLQLAILDSTDPDMLLDRAKDLDLSKTLFIVATKSGGTAETFSAFKYFCNQLLETMDADAAGQHFIAITDPGSTLVDLASQYNFRNTFLNDPNIGGRYSALSFFGLVPAALVGVDLETLLERAQTAACNAESCNCPVGGDNAGARLGAIMGELAKAGRDKVTIITSPAIASFGDWVEQLIAESTGKDGTGILPVVGETPGAPDAYGNDRLFVYIRLEGDDTRDAALTALEKAGHPVVTLLVKDAYDIGGQFFLWEMATTVAGARLGIQPFDQPNVEAAKVLAREMVAEYMAKGKLPAGETAPLTDEALKTFLSQARPGDYVSIHAYVHPTPVTDAALNDLRLRLRDKLKLATTVGYGPRFLHATGQLHKGDGGNGLFIQLTPEAMQDVPIPDEAGRPAAAMTFGVLKNAQALGDAQALRNAGRRVIRLALGTDVVGGLNRLAGVP